MQGLKYILSISGVTLLVVFIIVIGLRGCGLSRQYSAHDHPLLAEPQPWALLDLKDSLPRNFTWTASDVPLWTVEPADFAAFANQFKELTETHQGSLALFLPHNSPLFADQLIELTRDLGVGSRMIFLSPHDGLIRDLRKELPEALFSLGMADSTQLYLLHTFLLESLAQFSADLLLVTPEFLSARQTIPVRIQSEIRRRHKSTLLDLRQGGADTEYWLTPADGYILPASHNHLEILRQLRTKEGGQSGL